MSSPILLASYAAVVRDTDGSAFITKAEFDSLKNNFQAQIDNYNSSIDSKIDGAIASYLAGIKLSTIETFAPFFPVETISTLDIRSVEEGYMDQKEGYENGGSIDWMHQNPWYVINMNPYDPGTSSHLSFLITDYTTRLTSPKMKAFQMSQSDNAVLIRKYNKDIINISGFVYFNVNTYGNQEQHYWGAELVSEASLDTSCNSVACRWGMGTTTDTGASWYGAPYPKSNWYGSSGGFSSVPSGLGSPAGKSGLGERDTIKFNTIETANYSFTHSPQDEDKTIYLYNRCNDIVMAYPENSNKVARFKDNVATTQGVSYKDSQVMLPQSSKNLAWGRNTSEDGTKFVSNHYGGFCIPKWKMMNTTTITALKDNSNGWVNLNLFNNGYLEHRVGGVTKYPKFYGGLPLWNSEKDYLQSSFNIKLEPTTSGYTGNMRLWIKKDEFVNSNDFTSATWTSAEKAKLIDITGSVGTKNTDGSITIPNGTIVKITIPSPRNGDTYYLRFCEDNKSYGGKITYLSDFNRTLEN